MKKDPLKIEEMYEFLLIQKKVLSVLKKQPIGIRELNTKSPIQVNFQKLIQPDVIERLTDQIVSQIGNNEIEAVVGWKCPFLAFMVAKKLDLPFLLISPNEKMEDIQGKKVVFITDVICTGKNTSTALHYIQNAGAVCENVHCVFDFDFNLTTKGLRTVNIFSILNTKDLEKLETVSQWKTSRKYLFGQENRKEVFQSA